MCILFQIYELDESEILYLEPYADDAAVWGAAMLIKKM